jgi:hypothetical protein
MPVINTQWCRKLYDMTHNPDIPQHTIDAAKKASALATVAGAGITAFAISEVIFPPTLPLSLPTLDVGLSIGTTGLSVRGSIELYDKAKAYSELNCPLPKK